MKKIAVFVFFVFEIAVAGAQQAPEGLFINSKAPDFSVTDQKGQQLRLKDILKQKKKVVLVFYRGGWCPFGSRYLTRLQDSLSLMEEMGAVLIAVSPETAENVQATAEKTKAAYSMISDEGLKLMKAYQVDYTIPLNTLKRLQSTEIDINKINGKNGEHLPITATYIIDPEARVVYRFFDGDYKKNPPVKVLLENLD